MVRIIYLFKTSFQVFKVFSASFLVSHNKRPLPNAGFRRGIEIWRLLGILITHSMRPYYYGSRLDKFYDTIDNAAAGDSGRFVRQ